MYAEAVTWAHECLHYLNRHLVYCITPNAVNTFLDADISVKFNEIDAPWPVFEINWDEATTKQHFTTANGLLIENVFLVRHREMQELFERYAEDFSSRFDSISGPLPLELKSWCRNLVMRGINADKNSSQAASAFFVYFNLRNPALAGTGALNMRFNLMEDGGATVDSLVTSFAEQLNKQAYAGFMKIVPPDTANMMHQLGTLSQEIYEKMLKLICCLMMYLETADPDVVYEPEMGFTSDRKRAVHVVGRSFKEHEKSWHMRRAHWRCLRAERYHRGVPTEQRKPRFIFVRSHEVRPDKRSADDAPRELKKPEVHVVSPEEPQQPLPL